MISNRILVADDDEDLRALIAEALAEKGLKVTQATDGIEAMQTLQSMPSISILLTDIRMPRMDGYSLAEAAVAANPELKIIMMTGFADERPPECVLGAREVRILFKPIELDELCNRVCDMASRV
jgi:CheY-like chemotaxis protein